MTDDAIANLYVCDEKFRQIEGNGIKCRLIELNNHLHFLPMCNDDLHIAVFEIGRGKYFFLSPTNL